MTILSVCHLTKIFSNHTCALKEVSFEIEDHAFLAILGPSGAGKSTLIRSINRLIEPSSGKILVDGEDITQLHGTKLTHVRKNIGMIFQQFNLIERLDVLTNVLIGGLYSQPLWNKLTSCFFHTFKKEEKKKALECLELLGLIDCATQRVDTLSGGQKQRVAIARTLMQNPKVILADEPVSSLDPINTKLVLDYLKTIHDNNKIPIIINLHQADLAFKYASRIIGMNKGEIVFDGSVSQLNEDSMTKIYRGDLI